jgi:glycosyltransferase involved in cell wall biosynthesis
LKHTFIFQIHNRERTVRELLKPFVKAQNEGFPSELIVCNDGSTDDTYRNILAELNSATHSAKNTILTLFDVYEIILTNRAMRLAEGDIVHWIQDDDFYENMQFAVDAEKIFLKYPNIACLSPKHGYFFDKNMSYIASYGEYNSTNLMCHRKPVYAVDDKFMYVQAIDRAPFIFQKKYFDQVGGIDKNYIGAGYTESDLCLTWAKLGLGAALYKTEGYHFRKWPAGSEMPGSKATSWFPQNRDYCFRKHFK